MQTNKTLIISSGEPAGIGPDIIVKMAQHDLPYALLVMADPELLQARADLLNLPLHLNLYQNKALPSHQAGSLWVYPIKVKAKVEPGKLNPHNAAYVIECIETAAKLALNEPKHYAIVTAPVHKGIINEAGIQFSGHTEWLADFSHSKKVVMMLAADQCRVTLFTSHVPLAKVPSLITEQALSESIKLIYHELKTKFKLTKPHIAICGLNPHAGENGHIGREEIDIMLPVINKLKTEGYHVTGPIAADTLFAPKIAKQFDAILAMYHDQGLSPLKALHFGKIVNITLGLPFIRTSVDHGTALDIAGTGFADETSLLEALRQANLLLGT